MTDETVLDISYLGQLAPEWADNLLPSIKQELDRSTYKIIILDDDPTGTQTARDLPVLTTWTAEALEQELGGTYPAFFILTNSRSMTAPEACSLNREIGGNLKLAAGLARTPYFGFLHRRDPSIPVLDDSIPPVVQHCGQGVGRELARQLSGAYRRPHLRVRERPHDPGAPIAIADRHVHERLVGPVRLPPGRIEALHLHPSDRGIDGLVWLALPPLAVESEREYPGRFRGR